MTNFCGGRTSKILPWYPMHASACMGMPGYAWACPFGYLFGLSFVFLNWFSKSLMIFTFLNVMKLTGHARACLGIYRHARACPFGYLFGPSFVFVNWFSKSQMIFTFLNDMKLTRHAWNWSQNFRSQILVKSVVVRACPFGYLFGLSFVFLNWFSKSLMMAPLVCSTLKNHQIW